MVLHNLHEFLPGSTVGFCYAETWKGPVERTRGYRRQAAEIEQRRQEVVHGFHVGPELNCGHLESNSQITGLHLSKRKKHATNQPTT